MAESGARRSSTLPKLLVISSLLLAVFLLHIAIGSSGDIGLGGVVRTILGGGDSAIERTIVMQIRLPRALACVLVGALLGAVGSAFQALFRNPLADPYIVGVSSGAAIGGAAVFLAGAGGIVGGLAMPVAATATGLCSLAMVYGIARHRGVVDVTTLLLAGVLVGALLSAILSLIILAAGEDTNMVLRFLMGSMTPMFWRHIELLAIVLAAGSLILFGQTRRLNAFALGEETAERLGVEPGRLKATILVTGTAMTAAAVGAVGIVGFLGLVAPHIARRLVGVDWRKSLPAAVLLGAAILLSADVLAQHGIGTVRAGMMALGWMRPEEIIPTELPTGVVTAIIGAPFLLALLRRKG